MLGEGETDQGSEIAIEIEEETAHESAENAHVNAETVIGEDLKTIADPEIAPSPPALDSTPHQKKKTNKKPSSLALRK